MPPSSCRPVPSTDADDVIVGLDLARVAHQAVPASTGGRLTRFRVPHSEARSMDRHKTDLTDAVALQAHSAVRARARARAADGGLPGGRRMLRARSGGSPSASTSSRRKWGRSGVRSICWYLRTMPGLGRASVAGILAHVGSVDRYRHSRQPVRHAPGEHLQEDRGRLVARRYTRAKATLLVRSTATKR